MTRASADRYGPAKAPRQAEEGDPASVRVDVWLWSVRQVRSRSAATAACRAGHVRVNGDTAKPSQHLVVGDEVRLRVNGFDRYLRVERVLVKRVGAQVARTAFTDFSPPRPSPLDAPAAVVRSRGAGRPTKKERRQLDALMGGGRRRSTTSARDDDSEA